MSTEVKTFQVRDDGTHIPVMCVRVIPTDDERQFRRAGFRGAVYVIMTHLETFRTNYDVYKWPHRSLTVAHTEVLANWDSLKSGDVIDVQFILGETLTKKLPE